MIDLKKVLNELYEWQAKNPMVCYYSGIPLHKFSKFDLIVLASKLISDTFDNNKETADNEDKDS